MNKNTELWSASLIHTKDLKELINIGRFVMPSMNMLSKIIRLKVNTVLSVGLFVGFLGTSQAEDIEIFTNAFSSPTGQSIFGNSDFQPNVLLIVDNSTSMGRTGPVPDQSRQAVTLSEVILDSNADVGLSDNPEPQNDAGGFCDDDHTGPEGDVDTKNRFFYYPNPDTPNTFNVSFCETRFDTLQRSLRSVLADESDGRAPEDVLSDFNIGLMRMNRNRNGEPEPEDGGTIVSGIVPLDDDNNRDDLRDLIDELDFGQSTPVAETLYEGYLYFAGEEIENGFKSNTNPGGQQAEGQINWQDGSFEARAQYLSLIHI